MPCAGCRSSVDRHNTGALGSLGLAGCCRSSPEPSRFSSPDSQCEQHDHAHPAEKCFAASALPRRARSLLAAATAGVADLVLVVLLAGVVLSAAGADYVTARNAGEPLVSLPVLLLIVSRHHPQCAGVQVIIRTTCMARGPRSSPSCSTPSSQSLSAPPPFWRC